MVIIDGLTKNYRYPGWRVGWSFGPRSVIKKINRAASAIDGGPSTAAQRAAITVLEAVRADQEITAVRDVFAEKRALMLKKLGDLEIRLDNRGGATFYLWGNISGLPVPLNDADELLFRALDRKVMTIPDRYFVVIQRHRAPLALATGTGFVFHSGRRSTTSNLALIALLNWSRRLNSPKSTTIGSSAGTDIRRFTAFWHRKRACFGVNLLSLRKYGGNS